MEDKELIIEPTSEENELEIMIDEEPLESKIAGHQAMIDQLKRMIEASDSERMIQVFTQEIQNQQAEIDKLIADAEAPSEEE